MTNNRLLLTLAILLACNGVQAAITGAVTSGAGELAIINSDREAAWSVSPAEYMASYAVSDDGKTVYFASPKPGAVTFYAASVVDGLPNIESYTLYNGIDAPDDKDPTPAPVRPTPEPETVKTVIDKADTGATADEYNALANAFDAVVSGIDRGTITTPSGARETFRALWLQSAAKTNPDAIGNFSGLLDALSAKIDNTDLQTIRKEQGGYVGVTKDNVASGAKGLAFMGGFVRVFVFTVTALGANKDLGTAVYLDGDGDITWDSNDGSSPATAYTQLGWLWEAGKSGDTTIKVAIKPRS